MAHNAFELLERVVVPEFYDRDRDGVPRHWVRGMKRSMSSLAGQVSSVGMLRRYSWLYRRAERAVRTSPGFAYPGGDLAPASDTG
jgi:starch phosphorylase